MEEQSTQVTESVRIGRLADPSYSAFTHQLDAIATRYLKDQIDQDTYKAAIRTAKNMYLPTLHEYGAMLRDHEPIWPQEPLGL